MTNSFFNFNEAADFASQLQDSYESVNRSFDRREQLEQKNDQVRIQEAGMPIKMIAAAAEFSATAAKLYKGIKDKRYEDLEDGEYSKDDPNEQAKYDANANWVYTKGLPGFRKAEKIAIDNKDTPAIEILNNSPFAQHDDKMTTIQTVMDGVAQYWSSGGFKSAYEAATTPGEQRAIEQQFERQLTIRNPLLKGTNKRLIKNTVGRKVDNFIDSVQPSGETALVKKADSEYESNKNRKLLQALDESNVDYTFDNYKREYSYDYPNGMGGASHDAIERLYTLAKVSDAVSTDQIRKFMKADAGGMPYEERFPVIAGEMHTKLKTLDKEQATADAARDTQAYKSQNKAALDNARERLVAGTDPELIKRDLLRVQGNNRLVFAKENEDIDTFLEGMSISTMEFIKYNAQFEFDYGKGKLSVEEIEKLNNPTLTQKWLSRAQAQEKARTGSNYKDSKNSVEQLVKAADKIWGKQTRGNLLPHSNGVRGHLVDKFEEEFTKLTDANDPNAAVNAAVNVQTYFNANGGGEPDTVVGKKLFATTDGIFKNYIDSLKTSTIEVNPKAAIEFDIQSATTKIDMLNTDVQKALDTPNVFLNESEVNYEIERLINREGYSPKLKAMAARFGKHFAVGGPRGILERQAAVYDIKKESIPPEYDSIAKIYSEGNPLINCLISEKGFEGLSANQLLRQCSAISKDGVDDKDLEGKMDKRAAFQ